MVRPMPNSAGDMEVFTRVIELGGFSAAARKLGLSPSGVSKLVSRLEARLGSRLVNRSTRRLQLTPEGEAFYDRALRILSDIAEAEREAAAGACPRGHLRVNCNVPFGRHDLAPLLPRFLADYPEVTVELVLSDTVVDLMEERADVAVRVGPLRDSTLMARRLGASRMVVVAAPEYLARRGAPTVPADLADTWASGGAFGGSWAIGRSLRLARGWRRSCRRWSPGRATARRPGPSPSAEWGSHVWGSSTSGALPRPGRHRHRPTDAYPGGVQSGRS